MLCPVATRWIRSAALVSGALLFALGVSPARQAEAGETQLRLEGLRVDGTRHVDKVYVRDQPAPVRFMTVSIKREQPLALGTVVSDEFGRGHWHHDSALNSGDWRCLLASFEDSLHLTLWIHRSSGQVVYYGHDSNGQLQLSGAGKAR